MKEGIYMPILTVDYANINYEEMSKEIGVKPKHMPMLIGSFVEESAPAIEALSEAIVAHDFTSIASYAHSIKGSAGNLRFNEIYEMAKEMELAAKSADASFQYDDYLQAVKKAVATISI